MNLFITIIPFLILMISISQVALLALNFAADGGGDGQGEGGGGDAQEEILEIHLMLKEHETGLFPGMEIREPDKTTHRLPWLQENVYDFDGLNNMLSDMKNKFPESSEIAVIVHPEVLYDTLIRTIDLCKTNGFATVHYRNPKNQYYY
jgi:hypothetical protein